MINLKENLAKSRVRGELYIINQRLHQKKVRNKCAIIFPDQTYKGTPGDLRAISTGIRLRNLGWRSIIVPPWFDLEKRIRIVKQERPNVILLQQSRHPLNRPHFYPDIPCVFDVDDADFHNDQEPVIDCLRGSAAVITGNHYLAELFRPYNKDITVVWTGTYIMGSNYSPPNETRKPILTWAQSNPIDYPREASFIKDIILELSTSHKFSFYIYGINNQYNALELINPMINAGIDFKTFPSMHYSKFIHSLENVPIGLQPIIPSFLYSKGKSFGKTLGYLAARSTIIASREVDHPLFFRDGENGFLVNTHEEWIDKCKYLLDNPLERSQMSKIAYSDFKERLTTDVSTQMIEKVLSRVAT